jgi:hypothetical protein
MWNKIPKILPLLYFSNRILRNGIPYFHNYILCNLQCSPNCPRIFPGSNLKSTNFCLQTDLILKSKNRISHNYSFQSTVTFSDSVSVILRGRLSLYEFFGAFKRHTLSESRRKLFSSCRNCARKLYQKPLNVWLFMKFKVSHVFLWVREIFKTFIL